MRVSEAPLDHPCRVLVGKRAIPTERYTDLWHCDDFLGFTNSIVSGTYENVYPEARFVIPFRAPGGHFIGCQGRSYLPNSYVKYLTVRADEEKPFLYGYDRAVAGRKYVTEGPLDAMFIPNGCSAAGNVIGELLKINSGREDFVVVYDNEPRSPQTVKKIRKAIVTGFSVVIWPKNIREKDINEMALNRLDINFNSWLMDTLILNTFSGEMALTQLAFWSQCKL